MPSPILLDETAFVLLTREDGSFDLMPELARFMEKCRKQNPQRTYCVYSSKVVKKKLGFGWMYNLWNFIKTRDPYTKVLYQKRLRRRRIAGGVIVRFLPTLNLRVRPCSWLLKDLYLFVNEKKRKALGRPMHPGEIISLDMCMNALIAYRTGYPIVSFNGDYQYFLNLPHKKKSTIQYWKPEDILKQLPL